MHWQHLMFILPLLLLGTTIQADEGQLACDYDPQGHFVFSGVVGERIHANTNNWLIRAPEANPGLLAMFHLRDRQPVPNLVPWAGEFVGKYLISAIQARRMVSDAQLDATTQTVIRELIASQADDGYLGPFPKQERLLKHWDLWGHYHIMLALLMWHEQTGDASALTTCRKMADLICRTYLDTDRRMRDAGSTEMNLSVIHSLGQLYRLTSEPRYLEMMREIERDWETEGDYFRTGLQGIEFFRTPKPRWESFHDLQGLVELYRITGNQDYRTSFLNHWHSVCRRDRRNTGGFSSGEQATGSPYEPTAIETCCTIAWMAITVDALRLTGNPQMADELERSTFNGMLGAQHPSGSWWTYNTPMDGVREASDHTIVFQARAGTPELNCCSVNAPRGLGMLSEWAIMQYDEGLALNYFGPLQATVGLPDGTPVTIRQQTRYPLDGRVQVTIRPKEPKEFTLLVRIPSWAENTKLTMAGANSREVTAGEYLPLHRLWKAGDEFTLEFDMSLRYEVGDAEMAGRMSVYRGPLLLAYDQLLNDRVSADPPKLTPSLLKQARVSIPNRENRGACVGIFPPWVLVDVPLSSGETARLCDFASAGSSGSHYASWLPAAELPPPVPVASDPRNGQSVAPGIMVFTMRRSVIHTEGHTTRLEIATDPSFANPVVAVDDLTSRRVVLTAEQTRELKPNVKYYWKLVSANAFGNTESAPPAKCFQIDTNLPPLTDTVLNPFGAGPDGIVVRAELLGDPAPSYGELVKAQGWQSAPGPSGQRNGAVELDGKSGMLTYRITTFPDYEYTVSVWFAVQTEEESMGQVFSAWCRSMDDPLRICVKRDQLSAKIEAGAGYSTRQQPIDTGRWYHAVVVKQARALTMYLDGQPVSSISVPQEIHSVARDFALGGNPHFSGDEYLACRVSQLAFFARAMTADEVAQLHQQQRPKSD
jgi:DUF1680 family protein